MLRADLCCWVNLAFEITVLTSLHKHLWLSPGKDSMMQEDHNCVNIFNMLNAENFFV